MNQPHNLNNFLPSCLSTNYINAFLYNNLVTDKVQIYKEHQCGILWLKFCKRLFSFESDVFICNVYIPPHDSRVSANNDVDMFA